MDFVAIAHACAPDVHPQTMSLVVMTESGGNPYAIGVVGSNLVRQPRSLQEAIATARELDQAGFNFSAGLGQVNKKNFKMYGLTIATAFDACANLRASSEILKDCFRRSKQAKLQDEQRSLRDAMSCYYSGNFETGYRHGYVAKVTRQPRDAGAEGARTQSEGASTDSGSNTGVSKTTSIIF